MSKKIYVGNMSYNTSEEDLRDLFAQYGKAAMAAISQLNGKELDGRTLRVNESIAKPRTNSYNDYRY